MAAAAPTAVADGINALVNTCGGGNEAFQAWQVDTSAMAHITLKSTGECLDISNYGTTDNSNVWTFACHPEDKKPAHQNQAWTVNSNGTITSNLSGLCLTTSATSPGGNVQINTCGEQGGAGQSWSVNADGTIREKTSGLCMQSGGSTPPTPSPCDLEPGKSLPFCDYSLSMQARVKDLVGRMSTSDKLAQFANGAGAIPEYNIPAYQWWSEALHGVADSPGVHFGGAIPCATSFPQVITTAASFNATLFHAIGAAVGTEARALNNAGEAGNTFWAPNVK